MYADFAFSPAALPPSSATAARAGACCSSYAPTELRPLADLGHIIEPSAVTEYDLGEGDLFKAPEPIIEDPVDGIDPVVASMISGGDVAAMISSSDVAAMISGSDCVIAESLKVADIELIENDQFFSNVYYDCKKDLLEHSTIEESISELLDIKKPETVIDAPKVQETSNAVVASSSAEGPLQKSVSSNCLNTMDLFQGCNIRPSFLGFQGLDLEAALGLRRAYSEGDIQNLGNNSRLRDAANVQSSFQQMLTISDLKIEERRQKLSRYRKKKVKRNFGRKIKYACRKALADSQPRVRGRFAKIEECEQPKPAK